MKFNYVKFKNFLSFGNDVLYEISLDEPGITLLTGRNDKDGGSNGAGKSSAIVEAVVYAIFGLTTKNLKADQVVNNQKKANCYVEVSFDLKKDNYVVKRYRLHDEMKNALQLVKNGEDISREKIRDTQDLLESIILVSFKSVVLSVVLSQERVANFTEDDPIERKRIVENLLMFDWITKHHKAVKEILRKINPQLELLELQTKEKKDSIDTLTKNLLSYVDNWEAAEKAKKDRIAELQTVLDSWKHINIEQEWANYGKIHNEERELDTIRSKMALAKETRIKASDALDEAEEKYNEKIKEIIELNKHPEKCPVCKNNIKDEYFQGYMAEREEEKHNIGRQVAAMQDLQDGQQMLYDKLSEEGSEKFGHLAVMKKASKVKEEELDTLQQKITQTESEISVLSSQLKSNIEEDDYIKSTQKSVSDIKAAARKIQRKFDKLKQEAAYFDFWRNALGNSANSVKSFCVNYILKSLNKYIKYYLDFFNYDVSYTLDAELEDAIIKDGQEVSFSALSGGEKRSVEITLVFALYEIVRLRLPDNINIIVLDELLSNYLDDVRINGALEILAELEKRGLSIFVIDHKNLVKESLDTVRTINVVKDKDAVSSLEIL